MRKLFGLALALSLSVLVTPVAAQFAGPPGAGQQATVAVASEARLGTYVVLTGNIVSHERSDYFTFQDATGQVRVEISPGVWRGQEVTPDTTVRIMGEVSRGLRGRYIWVETLEIVN